MLSFPFLMGIIGAVIAMLIGIMIFSAVDESIDCEADFLPEGAKEDCENAKKISWTVIAILPITLFFVLFQIFGGLGGTMRVINIANVEERAKKMERLGVDHILRKTKARIIDRSKRGNELYAMEKIIKGYTFKYLKYEDPSTPNKIYGCFVPSEINSADEAMAWKFYITEEEYQNDLIYET